MSQIKTFRKLAKKKVACEGLYGNMHTEAIALNENCPNCKLTPEEDVSIPVRVLWEAQGI